MLPLDLLVAAVLLDPSLPVPTPRLDAVPYVKALALSRELLDPRETACVLARSSELVEDWKLLRSRAVALKDAPLVSTAEFLPSRSVISDLLVFNRDCRVFASARSEADPVHGWRYYETLSELDSAYSAWDLARSARCDFYYVSVRREALKKLGGFVLPPIIPLQFLSSSD